MRRVTLYIHKQAMWMCVYRLSTAELIFSLSVYFFLSFFLVNWASKQAKGATKQAALLSTFALLVCLRDFRIAEYSQSVST